MLEVLAFVAVVTIGVVMIAAYLRPDTFRVERSLRIAAPPAAVHPLINNIARMNSWSPFLKRDANVKGNYRGPAEGPGAAFDFAGNREVGKGTIEMIGSTPDKITMKLDMVAPMEGHNVIEFSLVPQGQSTEVTWAMHGASPYLSKLLGLVFNMDKMIGGAFEAGLAELKSKVERPA